MDIIETFPDCGLTGRRKIKTHVRQITRDNVVEVLGSAMATHALNAMECHYLYDVYRGKQDIRTKQKYQRENINNKVVVNRANEIVTFKSAYLLSSPYQYTSYNGAKETSDLINELNELMRSEDKESKDKEIVDWVHICGVGERLTLPDPEVSKAFHIYTIAPWDAFVIYSSNVGEAPMAGVILQLDEEGAQYATVYTADSKFEIHGNDVSETKHILGLVPLEEYLSNTARQGAFEIVLSILNNINLLESCAIDSVEDFVNGFDVFQNCQIDDSVYSQLSIGGKAINVKSTTQGMEAKVYRIASELNQTGTQTRIDDLTEAYLTICGMPNRNGGSSTSDTGTAVIYRDGFFEAESRAKDTDQMFKRSERRFLKTVLRICGLGLTVDEIKIENPRGNLANLQSKVQVLCQMLDNEKIHPKLAFDAAGLFADNETAYRISMEYAESVKKEQEENLNKELENARTTALRAFGSDDTESAQESGAEIQPLQETASDPRL